MSILNFRYGVSIVAQFNLVEIIEGSLIAG